MDITLEMVEKVMSATGADYAKVKAVLLETEGNTEEAIARILAETQQTEEQKAPKTEVDRIVEKIKEAVEEGNVTRVQISRKGETILNIPVTAGVVGGVIGLWAVPWAVVIAAIAAYGAECKVTIVKKDGTAKEII